MTPGLWHRLRDMRRKLQIALIGPQTLAFLPAITLGGYWFGGEGALLFMALVFPGAFAIAGMFSGTGPAWSEARDKDTDLLLRGAAERSMGDILTAEPTTGQTTAALVLEIDDFRSVEQQNGTKETKLLLRQIAERLTYALREKDIVVRLDGPRFGVALGPIRRADLGAMIQLSARLQGTIAEPYSIDAARVFVTASIGFCLSSRVSERTGAALLDCAEVALEVAKANGEGTVRAYRAEDRQRPRDRGQLQKELADALDCGQIQPWFQPQVSTSTGELSGLEALARWNHPDRGTIPPAEFLPLVEKAELMERLGEVMLSQSLSALRSWEKSNLNIPQVSVNFSSEDLSNPKICDRVTWELDRYELEARHLCIEILEDVIAASQDDVIVKNIQGLAELGCHIDLDDFGTGHASIANIRRFSVNRIKIDRTFITRVDRDQDQQSMVAAILTMAERLKIDTLAEGVETIGEHALLAQLGCGHVQGFSVARPMPYDDVPQWIAKYRAKLPEMPNIGRKAG